MAKPTRYNQEMYDRYLRDGNWTKVTISDYWNRNARLYPDKEALVDSKTRLTWAQANLWIDRLALAFLEVGLNKDDVVVIQLPNCAELACLRVASERAGLLHLPAQRVFRHAEMEHVLKYTEAKAVVIPWKYRQFDYVSMIQELKPGLPSLQHVLIWGDLCPAGTISLKELIERPIEKNYPPDYLENKKMPWSEFSLVATTTGTTGKPKFVEQPVCALLANQLEIDLVKVNSEDVLVGMSNAVLGPNVVPYIGGPVMAAKIALLEHWSVEEGLIFSEKERATIICGVPTQIVEINAYPDLNKHDLSYLRAVWSTGSILPYHLASELEEKLNCPIINVYGAVDFGGMSGSSISDPKEIRLMSIGRPYLGNEVKIIDDSGNQVPLGETGRLCFKGAKGASGYYKDPAATALKWTRDGWYVTGDLGRIDERGVLFISGRSDDMVIRGGQNIHPVEIENLLLSHPGIKDAAVVGIPDTLMGERACACIVPNSGENFSFEEMLAFLKGKQISPYKLPEKLLILESLPYVSGLKLDRKQLKIIAQKQLL